MNKKVCRTTFFSNKNERFNFLFLIHNYFSWHKFNRRKFNIKYKWKPSLATVLIIKMFLFFSAVCDIETFVFLEIKVFWVIRFLKKMYIILINIYLECFYLKFYTTGIKMIKCHSIILMLLLRSMWISINSHFNVKVFKIY